MKEITRLQRFINKHEGEEFLCHFYIESGREKQYYGKSDFAYLNLASDSSDWIIKGTPEHGISDVNGDRSKVPCLNCFEVNESFIEALKDGRPNNRFSFGLLFRRPRAHFKVIPVKAVPNYFPRPPLNECHHYDLITKRKALTPFEECDIVRLEVSRRRILNQPLDKIPGSLIIGMLVNQDIPVEKIEKRLAMKGISDAPIFSLL